MIVPNQHIETKTFTHIDYPIKYGADDISEHTSYHTLIENCKSEEIFKNHMLFYIEKLKQDAKIFAENELGFNDINVVVAKKINARTYEKSDADKIKHNLFMVVHFENNSMNHMHVHCYVPGNGNLFKGDINHTNQMTQNVFSNNETISLSIDALRRVIDGNPGNMFDDGQ